MDWRPLELTEERIDGFATSAAAFAASLDAAERRLWRELIRAAGGDGGHADRGDTALDAAELREMLHGVWQAGTAVAPLYSGAMPEGGGTVD
ncbi:MAG TPA: hypothetical protein VH916_00430 [Dehalococcoidia bacterium]